MNTTRCLLSFPVRASILVAAFTSFSGAYAVDVVKADNTRPLQGGDSWVGGVVPTATDRAVWNSTLTGANTSFLQADLSAQGLFIDNPAGAVTIRASSLPVLSLGSSGIEVSGANLTFQDTGTISLVSDQTWSIASGRTLTLGSSWGTLTGSGNLEVTGPGSFMLAGGNGTRIYTFGSGAVTLGGGVRLINDATDVVAARTRTITNATTLNGDITLQMNATGATGGGNSDAFIFSGGFDIGSADRTITLAMPDLLSTFSAYSTARSVLELRDADALSGSGTVNFVNESLDPNKATHVRVVGGAGTITVDEINVGQNVYLTTTGSTADIGAGTAVTVQSGGFLALGGQGNTTGGTRTIKSLAGAGGVLSLTTNATTAELVIDGGAGTGRTDFSGTIENGPTAGYTVSVTKSGSTTQVFSGSNTYTGVTTINGGSLIQNGTHVQATSGLGYVVNSGATLGGTGRIAISTTSNTRKAVELKSGAFLSAGDGGIGTLILDGVNFASALQGYVLYANAGSQFNFDLAGDGTSADTIDLWNYIEGDVFLDSNAVNLTLDGSQVSGTYTVSIFNFFEDNGSTIVSSGITSGLVLGTLGEGISDVSFNFNSGGSTIDLTYTVTAAVPEPSTFAAIFGGISLVVVMIRRRRS